MNFEHSSSALECDTFLLGNSASTSARIHFLSIDASKSLDRQRFAELSRISNQEGKT
jgi:hypothetical protein